MSHLASKFQNWKKDAKLSQQILKQIVRVFFLKHSGPIVIKMTGTGNITRCSIFLPLTNVSLSYVALKAM